MSFVPKGTRPFRPQPQPSLATRHIVAVSKVDDRRYAVTCSAGDVTSSDYHEQFAVKEAQAHRRAYADVEAALPVARVSGNGWKALPPSEKVRIIEAMGFTPCGDGDHTLDCPSVISPGCRCNCVPGATQWSGPSDVDEYRGETWERRLIAARKRKQARGD